MAATKYSAVTHCGNSSRQEFICSGGLDEGDAAELDPALAMGHGVGGDQLPHLQPVQGEEDRPGRQAGSQTASSPRRPCQAASAAPSRQ